MTYLKTASLTYWAARNILLARVLYGFIELSRLGILLFLGFSLAPAVGINEFLIIYIVILPIVYTLLKKETSRNHIKAYFRQSFALMLCSGALFFSMGGLFGNKSSAQIGNQSRANDIQTELKSGTLDEIMANQKSPIVYHKKAEKKKSKRTFLHMLLFVLSLGLTYVGIALSCTLACSGYGVIAWLALITTFGILGGGVFFLIKAFSKRRPIGYKRMSKSQRKKEWKNFLLTWAGVVLSFLLTILIINI